jgi:hypothetical protein
MQVNINFKSFLKAFRHKECFQNFKCLNNISFQICLREPFSFSFKALKLFRVNTNLFYTKINAWNYLVLTFCKLHTSIPYLDKKSLFLKKKKIFSNSNGKGVKKCQTMIYLSYYNPDTKFWGYVEVIRWSVGQSVGRSVQRSVAFSLSEA